MRTRPRNRRGEAASLALGGALVAAGASLLDVQLICVDPTDFPELRIEAEIIDRDGYTLRTLDRRHLALYEDDELLKLIDVQLDKDAVHTVLALDASGTMIPATDQVKDAASNLLRLMDPVDHAAVLEFSSEPRMLARFGESRARAVRALNAVVPYGPTALYDGLYRSLLELGGRSGRRNVVVITDGKDQNRTDTGPGSRRTEPEVLALAKKMEVTIHAIALGPLAMKKELARLANRTGGSAWYAPRAEHLEDLYRRVLQRLKGRLVIRARTLQPKLDGTRRRIDLRVRAGQAYGEDTAGYVAPGRWVLDLGPVRWKRKKGGFEDVAKRLVALKDVDLEELEPADRASLLEWARGRFVLPEE